jgi:hypothetical protein
MVRPTLYATEAERLDAKREAWQRYNKRHKAERAAHNKAYCQREDVKARRRQMYEERKAQTASEQSQERVKMV